MPAIVSTLLTFTIALVFLSLMDFFAHRGWIESRLSRKLIHIGTGPIFVLCWLFYPDVPEARWLAALVPFAISVHFALVGFGLIKDQAAVQAMSRSGDRCEILRVPLYYGIIFVLMTILIWKGPPAGITALMIICALHRRGFGAVERYGIVHGKRRYCLFVSADNVDHVNFITQLYNEREKRVILSQCSRHMRPGDDSSIPFSYKLFQFLIRIGVRIAIGHSISDSTFAFKMFHRRELLEVGVSPNRFNIGPEITYKSILIRGDVSYVTGAQGVRQSGKPNFSSSRRSSDMAIAWYAPFSMAIS
jgi:hypothetical protein